MVNIMENKLKKETSNGLNKKKIIGIMGFGEIGKSVAKLYPKSRYEILSKNLKQDNLKNNKIDVLHICFPYSQDFVKESVRQVKKNKPEITIIESTVDVGITKKINQVLKTKSVVHSPVRGMHPNLTKSLKCFIKYIGAETKTAGDKAAKNYHNIGVRTKVFIPSESTELNKILSTSYYGLCIAWTGEVKRLCDKFGVNFKTFEDFNDSYNKGYKKMGRKNVIRPTLYPPKKGIGGHCVWENAIMFNPKAKSEFLKLIIKAGKDRDAKKLKVKKIK